MESTQDLKVVRRELKYYISYKEYLVLSDLLKKVLRQDKHNKDGHGYFVRSLYFDNLYDRSFEDKMAGIEERSKYRLRLYAHTQLLKFEIKSRHNDLITKESAVVSREDAEEIQKCNYEAMLKYGNKVLNKAYAEFKKSSYRPVVLVDYLREAFVFDTNEIRIVFDRFLRSSISQLDIFQSGSVLKPQLKKGIVVMEVKYNYFVPNSIKKLIQIKSFSRSAISKYCTGRLDEFENLF